MISLTKTDIKAIDTLMREVSETEIMPFFGKLSDDMISQKSSATDLVTLADQQAERALIKGLQHIFPQADVFGEETVAADPARLDHLATTDLSIVIDPIDGTWNYAHGIAVFGVIIAVISQGKTIAGLIHDPLSGETIHAIEGEGAFVTNAAGKIAPLRQPAHPAETDLNLIIAKEFIGAHDLPAIIAPFSRVTSLGCSAHEYRLLCKGLYHGAICHGLLPWDHAAGELIYRETGGQTWVREIGTYTPDMTKGKLLLAANPAVMTLLKR